MATNGAHPCTRTGPAPAQPQGSYKCRNGIAAGLHVGKSSKRPPVLQTHRDVPSIQPEERRTAMGIPHRWQESSRALGRTLAVALCAGLLAFGITGRGM